MFRSMHLKLSMGLVSFINLSIILIEAIYECKHLIINNKIRKLKINLIKKN